MYRIVIQGHEVRCDTAQEVAQLLRHIDNHGLTAEQVGTTRSESISPRERYVLLLDTLIRAGEDGVAVARLASVLDLKSGKGLGGIRINLREAIRSHGISIDDVISRRQTGTEIRWIAGSKAPETLEALRQNS